MFLPSFHQGFLSLGGCGFGCPSTGFFLVNLEKNDLFSPSTGFFLVKGQNFFLFSGSCAGTLTFGFLSSSFETESAVGIGAFATFGVGRGGRGGGRRGGGGGGGGGGRGGGPPPLCIFLVFCFIHLLLLLLLLLFIL